MIRKSLKLSSLTASLGGGGVGNAFFGINYSSNKTDRLWTDNQTSILGTNSVTINTVNNTDIKGAVIANSTNGIIGEGAIDGSNLTLNTGSLTFSNLYDHEYYQNTGFGFSTNIGLGKSSSSSNNTNGQGTASANNPNQQNNFYPSGSTTLSLNNNSYKKEQTTFATIGAGNITTNTTLTFDADGNLSSSAGGTLLANDDSTLTNLNHDVNNTQVITKDMITGALDVSVTVDNRLFTKDGRSDMKKEQEDLGRNLVTTTKLQGELLETTREVAEDKLGAIGTVLTAPTQIVEGTIFTFLEEKNSLEGSYLINKNGITTDPTKTKNYAVNGIITTNDSAFTNYISDPNNDVILRYNPTHGFFGDLIESAVGKISNIIGTPQIVAMNNYVAEDLYQRSELSNSTNTFHSQGSIIGTGAIQLYANTYQLGFDLNGDALPRWQNTQINQTQQFVAVGPAVLKSDWKDTTKLLGDGIGKISDYSHNENDPIRYLTAPSNMITDVASLFADEPVKSPIYIPNLITNIPQGIWNAILHMEKHDVKDENYSKFLKGSQEQNSQNPSTTSPNN